MDKLLFGHQVLVVEDEMMVLMLIEDMLADLGCQSVLTASTVPKALTIINEQAIDLVFLDMNLNGVDSRPIADALEARGVRFIYSTGNSGGQQRSNGGERPILKKPFAVEDLVAVLTRSSSAGMGDLSKKTAA